MVTAPHHARKAARATARSTARAGLTLLELILTMGILGIVFGAGVGILTSLDLTSGQSAGLVRSALAAASGAALREGAPARLEVSTDRTSLYVIAPRTLGTWHFERDDGQGARGLQTALFGAANTDEGHMGSGLVFSGKRRDAYVELGLVAGGSFDPTAGLAIELAVCLDELSPGRLLDVAGVAGLDVQEGGALSGWILPARLDESGVEVVGAKRVAELPAGVLLPGRWVRVGLSYDRVELRITADGFPASIVSEVAPLSRAKGAIVLGGTPRAFVGRVDTVVVRQAEVGEPLVLPEGTLWPEDGPRAVRFEADGALDRGRHPTGLDIGLELPDGARVEVRVTPYGAVQ